MNSRDYACRRSYLAVSDRGSIPRISTLIDRPFGAVFFLREFDVPRIQRQNSGEYTSALEKAGTITALSSQFPV